MGYPNDVKEVDSTLPKYVPIPSDHDTSLSELPSTEQRRRRLRLFIKHAAVLLITGCAFYHFMHRGSSLMHTKSSKHVKTCGSHWNGHDEGHFLGADIDEHHPHPSDCKKWSVDSEEDDSKFMYSFPISSSSLNFITRGPFTGTVDYVLADEDASSDSIEVEISLAVHHHHHSHDEHSHERTSVWRPMSWIRSVPGFRKEIKPKAKVCLLVDGEESVGFSIMSHPPHHHEGHGPKHPHHPPHLPHPPHPPSPPKAEPLYHLHSRAGHDRLSAFGEEGSEHHPHPHPHPPHFDEEEHPHPHHHHHHHHQGEHAMGGKHLKHFHHKRPLVEAKIVITIPRGAATLPKLVSVFPGLEVNVNAVFAELSFDDLVLAGKNVVIETVNAQKAQIVTGGESDIDGTYTITDKLSIVAHNASVSAVINLISAPNAEKPTAVDIINKAGPIAAQIALITTETTSSSDVKNNGSFAINSVSSESSILTNVTAQPINSVVKVSSISSSTSGATALLPSSFEGKFSIVGTSDVEIDEDAEDPAGEGRKRAVDIKNVFGKFVYGSVKWVEADEGVVESEENVIGGWEVVDWEEEKEEMDVHAMRRKLKHDKVFHAAEGVSVVHLVTKKGLSTLVIA